MYLISNTLNKTCAEPWFCCKYIIDVFLFGTIKNQNFSSFVLNNNKKNTNTGRSIYLKPPPNLSLLFNQFKYLSSDVIKKNQENMTNYKYYDTDDIRKRKLNQI